MRNGLNIAAVSELVHEIQSAPEEALIRLGARLSPLGPNLMEAKIQTLAGGTIRVARDFRVLLAPVGGEQTPAASCQEHLMVALAGCVLVTFVQGCSARGITIASASVATSSRVGVDATGRPWIGEIAYEYNIDCDGAPDVLLDIAKYVSCLSPNHRAFIERGSVRIGIDGGGEAAPSIALDDGQSGELGPRPADSGVQADVFVDWIYGTQLTARVSQKHQMLIDQPKQYLGLDSAANPQEYLLAAAGAELAYELRREAQRRDSSIRDISVSTYGSLDLRGITNVDTSAPVKVHDIAHTLRIEPATSLAELEPLVMAAGARCLAHELICREQTIEVRVCSRGERIASFRSDKTLLRDYLAELARRKQALGGAP